MQYSLTNLNAFIILITIGFSLYLFVEKKQDNVTGEASDSGHTNSVSMLPLTSEIKDLNNSPIQLISQMKGYFYINPFLALSLAITVFSFVGIPPLAGFFAKQMVLSSALDNGYVFMVLIAILTSVVSAYYYLAIVKQIFFHKTDYILNPVLENITLKASIFNSSQAGEARENITVKVEDIKLSSSLTTTISILTLIILFFILIPQE
jgi:NADH-ubiquinone oxidoreductase chain 2